MFNYKKKKKMKKIIFMVCACAALITTSCNYQSDEAKRLKAQNDSLMVENTKANDELNEMLSTLDEIEADFQNIRDAENYLTIQQQEGGEMTPTRREKIRDNMKLISETLKKNKEQIAKLEEQMKKSGIQSAALKKTLARLNKELETKTAEITSLRDELAKKNVQIQELDGMVSELNEDVENLSTTNAVQAEKLNEQDKAIHTAYYCFGTSKELKAQNIINKNGLFGKTKVLPADFNKDYFISIDIREVKEIPLFSPKAKLHSNHPEGSYEFVKDEEKNITLHIIDADKFWSLGKYLVIEVG